MNNMHNLTPHFLYPPNPGTDAHIAQVVAHDLHEKGVVLGDSIEDMKQKGVPFEQEFINDKPQHLVWYEAK